MNYAYQIVPRASNSMAWRLGQFTKSIGNQWQGLLTLIGVWEDRIKQRRDLARLSDQLLDDLNLDRQQALAEIEKPFWRR